MEHIIGFAYVVRFIIININEFIRSFEFVYFFIGINIPLGEDFISKTGPDWNLNLSVWTAGTARTCQKAPRFVRRAPEGRRAADAGLGPCRAPAGSWAATLPMLALKMPGHVARELGVNARREEVGGARNDDDMGVAAEPLERVTQLEERPFQIERVLIAAV